MPIRVMDSVPAYRAGLVGALRQAGYRADGCDDEAHAWADEDGPQALLATLRTESDWERLTRLGRSRRSHLTVVALLTSLTSATHQVALQRGASAAVAWDAPLDTVLAVLAAALDGRVLVPLEIAVALGHGQTDPDPQRFTTQDLQWLRMLAAGATVTALAERSRQSDRTMYRRLADLYTRLGVNNRSEAIATATRWGLLDPDAAQQQLRRPLTIELS